MESYFCCFYAGKKFFSAADQLGTMAFLCTVFSHQLCVVLVLYKKPLTLVLQFI
jgi:hypothetical protein